MNPEEELQAIIQAVAQLNELFQQRMATGPLSEDVKLQFAQLLNAAGQRVVELQRQIGQPPQAPPGVPDAARLLWILSGGDPQHFANYLHTFPDPTMNALMSNPAQLQRIVAQLQAENPQQRNGQIAGVPQAALQSSNVWGFQYEPKSKKLRVRFQSGAIYDYDGVPPFVFQLFQSGAHPCTTTGQNRYGRWWRSKQPSLGSALNAFIKLGGYPYHRLGAAA